MNNHKDCSAQELFDFLNEMDECSWIEAKGCDDSANSIMETVCAFSNEPNLGGGYIILGVGEDRTSDSPSYIVEGVSDPDKSQLDFATRCASMFNKKIRPDIVPERVNDKILLKIWIDELPTNQKPLYFLKDSLPRGAYRRIGSSDQRCTDDDLILFYSDNCPYDQSPVKTASVDDVDKQALERYRILRSKVNSAAEELVLSDSELLEALGCVNRQNKTELNLAGVLLFGSAKLQRSILPMMRIDYIRISGNEWVKEVDDTFVLLT
ncbi:MAG: putative DNA binding domain-containing protein [Planctomycetia bacterium]|nr:putative DNA binding domain-containing protein [Planctomycetia bacterium]